MIRWFKNFHLTRFPLSNASTNDRPILSLRLPIGYIQLRWMFASLVNDLLVSFGILIIYATVCSHWQHVSRAHMSWRFELLRVSKTLAIPKSEWFQMFIHIPPYRKWLTSDFVYGNALSALIINIHVLDFVDRLPFYIIPSCNLFIYIYMYIYIYIYLDIYLSSCEMRCFS